MKKIKMDKVGFVLGSIFVIGGILIATGCIPQLDSRAGVILICGGIAGFILGRIVYTGRM